jgi:tetratricopeptide (TPR) repeat protein
MYFGVCTRLGLALVGLPAAVWAGNSLAATGYEHFYNLEYDAAIADFARLTEQEPLAAEGYNHLAEAILYRAMFRAGALETQLVTGNNPFLRRPRVNAGPEEQRQFESAIGRAIELAQARLTRDETDEGALYALGVSDGLRANYNFLVRKAWRDALRDATTARRMHNRVSELDPGRVDARLVQGLHDYIVGSLPLTWRMLGFLTGFHGNREGGIRAVELVASKGESNRLEAEFLLCAIYRRESQPQKAVPLLEDLMRRFPRNFLLPMELAQMYSDLGEGAKALELLAALEKQKRSGAYGQLPLEKIHFAEGNIQFWYNWLDAALENMRKASSSAEDLDLNTGVLAWMRLGQIYDLTGQRLLAREAYRRAIAFAPDSEAAKESRGYLASPYRRRRKG